MIIDEIDNELEELMAAADDERDGVVEPDEIDPIEPAGEIVEPVIEPIIEPEPEPIDPVEPAEPIIEPIIEPEIELEIEPIVEPEFKPVTLTVDGRDFEVTSMEDFHRLATRGANVKAPRAESMVNEKNIIEQGKLSQADLTLLIDAKNGDANAIAKIAELGKIDVMDLTEDMSKDYAASFQMQQESEVDKVAREIMDGNGEAQFRAASETTPQDFRDEIATNAGYLRAFATHITDGKAEGFIANAKRNAVMSGKTFMQCYIQEATSHYSGQNNTVVAPVAPIVAPPVRQVSAREIELRQLAADSRGGQGEAVVDSGKDVWDLSDKEFAKLTS